MHEEEPTSTSPEDEPGPSCSKVDTALKELTVPQLISQSELQILQTERNVLYIRNQFVQRSKRFPSRL